MDRRQKEVVRDLKKANKKKKSVINLKWVMTITVSAFLISMFFSFLSEMILPNVAVLFEIVILILFILLGVLFDMVGVSVTAADEKPFHSMNAQKIRGANVALIFKKNADKVSSFCNDVIGDICGIISGSAGVMIAVNFSQQFSLEQFFLSLIVTGITAALTIGGKALGKGLAISKANMILYEFSKVVSYFYQPKK